MSQNNCQGCKCECQLITDLQCLYQPFTPINGHTDRLEVQAALKAAQDCLIKNALRGCFDELCAELEKCENDPEYDIPQKWQNLLQQLKSPLGYLTWYFHFELFERIDFSRQKEGTNVARLAMIQEESENRWCIAKGYLDTFTSWLYHNKEDYCECIETPSCCCPPEPRCDDWRHDCPVTVV